MRYPNFIGPSYESQAVTADQERTVNLYEERIESPGGTSRVALYPTPGVELIHMSAAPQGRANAYYAGRQFIIDGSFFFEIDSDGNVTFHAFVATDDKPATISYNGDGGGELFITSGGNGYLFVLATDTFSTIAALAGKATMGEQLDGYFLALDANTGTFYASDLLDGATWQTGVMFAQRNQAPDPWWSMIVNGKYIWLMGSETGEVWYNAGSSPFPFSPHPSGFITWGTAAQWSPKVCDSSLVWLGASKAGHGSILRATGFTPEVVSTYPVEYAIGRYGEIGDAYSDCYKEAGHTFYQISFGKANHTWVYDLQMQAWHERGTWDTVSNVYTLWRPRCHAFAFGEHVWLDVGGGGVYRMAIGLPNDINELPIRRLRRAPALQQENERIYYPGLELDLEPGLGLVTGQGEDPQVMMRMSNDGGKTFGMERWRSAGKLGEYGKRVRWLRLGAARRRVFEVAFSDPTPWRLTAAYLIGIAEPQQRRTA